MKGSAAIRRASSTPRKIAKSIAKFASDKKAEDIKILDMRKQVNFCDYFIICSGNSDRQVNAIADYIQEELKKLGVHISSQNGSYNSSWVVFDTGDIIVHVFQKQAREFYNLEGLWQEAKTIKWEE